MNISQFARLAVRKPKISNIYQVPGLQEILKTRDPLSLLTDVLEESGAKVFYKANDYFISNRLGGIPIRLKWKERAEVRKSYALLRILPKKEFMVRAGLAIADLGALAITKESIEMLQLSNLCLKVIVVIREEDILVNTHQLHDSGHADYFRNAYLLTGQHSALSMFDPWLRNIPDLTIYVIAKSKEKTKKRQKFPFRLINA
ncbi:MULTISPECIES: hypothetical protein [Pedobacter]|uniref:hypothetical protein n=1 Tax=Pedobacter TaxID=84567 RepID=UPI001E39C127|nr:MULTISPECIES: hypothetical protein [Pedobacter]